MRPKATFIQNQEAIRRKNRTHWLTHKYEISVRRMKNKANFKRLQKKSNITSNVLTNLNIDDVFSYLSIDENPIDAGDADADSSFSDVGLENEYFIDADEENGIQNDKDESEDFNEEIEQGLSEEQMKFSNEFFNMENTIPIRDYDELVSNKFLVYTCSGLLVVYLFDLQL